MELWKHQSDAVARSKEIDNLALFFEVGTGKTATIINALRWDYNVNKRIRRTLIMAPLSVCPQWKREFEKFSKVPQDQIVVLTQDGKKRAAQMQRISQSTKNFIIVTNYEGLSIKPFYDLLKAYTPEIVVLDESQKIKDSSSKRAKLLYPICDRAARRFLLTGTPVLNSMMDLFGQYRAMDSSIFGTSFFMFRAKYFYDKNAGMSRDKHFPDWRPLPDAEKMIAEKIASTSIQAKKSECLDLPPLVKVEVPVKVNAAQAKAYEGMLKEFVAELDGNMAIAEFAMTKTLRLMQILSGYLAVETDTNERDIKRFDDVPRLKAVKELLESIGEEKTIIWAIFKPNYADLQKVCNALNKEYVMLTGEQTAAQKQEAIDKFCRGSAQVMIANPAAGGAGINLQEAKYAIYFNKNYSLEQFLQSEGRNYRGGSNMHDKITHYHLFVPGTIDEVISSALLRKQDVAETVLAWAKNVNITLDTLPEDIVL